MQWFSDMKVGMKLGLAFLILVVIGLCVGVGGIAGIRHITEADTHLYRRITVPLEQINTIAVSFQHIRINLRDAVETRDDTERQNCIAAIRQLRQQIAEAMDKLEKTITTDDERRLFAEVRQARAAYVAVSDRILALASAGSQEEAMELIRTEGKKIALHYQEQIDKLTAAKESQARLTSEQNTKTAAGVSTTMAVLTLISVILSVLMGVIVTGSITRPLRGAVDAAAAIAGGDLTVRLRQHSRDETGQLMAAMEQMVTHLARMIAGTVDISSGIASASQQLHATAEQIATGAEEVAAQAGAVATASEEMAATSNDIARNCSMAAEASQQSTDAANTGARVVQTTITGMGVIAERVRETAHTVEALGARSEQIGNIVGTIEDIADQTNLLALNAAIEAARAGEYGRGFAVVADEVRALAERTTKATREIGEMIKAIQNETKAAVRAMEEGVSEVEKGAESSQQSGVALEEILQRINEVSLQVSQIATAAEEQTATTNEVTTNVQQITEVVGQTARGAEETAGAAAQLARQAQELQHLVSQFKLG
jgi:methyl-accepting chemotaxis protein